MKQTKIPEDPPVTEGQLAGSTPGAKPNGDGHVTAWAPLKTNQGPGVPCQPQNPGSGALAFSGNGTDVSGSSQSSSITPLFEAPTKQQPFEPLRFTPAAEAKLTEPLAALPPIEDQAAQIALSGASDEDVKRQVEATFDAEPSRAERRTQLEGIRVAVDSKLSSARGQRDRLQRRLEKTTPSEGDEVPRSAAPAGSFKRVLACVFVVLLLLATVAEWYCAMTLAHNTGINESRVGDFLMTCCLGIALTVGLKRLCDIAPTEKMRRRIDLTVQVLAVPLAIAGMVVFAITFARAIDPGQALLTGGHDESLPPWVPILATMMVSSLTALAFWNLASVHFAPSAGDGPQRSSRWTQLNADLQSAEFAVLSDEALEKQVLGMLATLEAERHRYAGDAILAARTARRRLELQRAKAELEEFDRISRDRVARADAASGGGEWQPLMRRFVKIS